MSFLRLSRSAALALAAVSAISAVSAACSGDSAASSSTADMTATARAVRQTNSNTRSGPALDVVGIASWINSEPVSIQEELDKNNVVLVDFWTYTCVNCIRTLPFLKEWEAKYKDHGLVLLGVHSPEFEFEQELENVQTAVDDLGVTWPVALDNEMRTWNAFGNRFWPAKYLFTPEDGLEFTHFGEGAYVEMEEEIRKALEGTGRDLSDIPVGTINVQPRDETADRVTREIYGGYERGYHPQGLYAGNDEYYIEPDQVFDYVDNGEYDPQRFYLQGAWKNEAEAIVHARNTTDLSDYIALEVTARSANVVINPKRTEPFDVFVTAEDQPLTQEEAGDDVLFDSEGRSYFHVDQPRMYRFLEQPEFKDRIIKLSSTSNNFAVYAFTFGVYQEGF